MNYRPSLLTGFYLALALAASQSAFAQAPVIRPGASINAEAPMDAAERATVVEDLAKRLNDSFVFPDVAARYAAMLREKLSLGAYDQLTDPSAFAKRITEDLQAVSPDRHLRLAPAAAFAAMTARVGGHIDLTKMPPALEEAKMIDTVAYLRFNLFPDDPAVATQARNFLLQHADAKAVIIDSRTNHGGDLTVMDQILPLLYARPTILVRMDTRASADDGRPSAAIIRQTAPKSLVRYDHRVIPDTTETRLQKVPVFYLVSAQTGSAAEHLALAFKRTKRATIIGQTTAGLGHYGGVEPIGKRFAAFIPVGRTYDPDTNWDWEGVGVTPDVVVPADQALDEALNRISAGSVGASSGTD